MLIMHATKGGKVVKKDARMLFYLFSLSLLNITLWFLGPKCPPAMGNHPLSFKDSSCTTLTQHPYEERECLPTMVCTNL